MGKLIPMSELTTEKVETHQDHELVIARYGTPEKVVNLAIECTDCNELLADWDVDNTKKGKANGN